MVARPSAAVRLCTKGQSTRGTDKHIRHLESRERVVSFMSVFNGITAFSPSLGTTRESRNESISFAQPKVVCWRSHANRLDVMLSSDLERRTSNPDQPESLESSCICLAGRHGPSAADCRRSGRDAFRIAVQIDRGAFGAVGSKFRTTRRSSHDLDCGIGVKFFFQAIAFPSRGPARMTASEGEFC